MKVSGIYDIQEKRVDTINDNILPWVEAEEAPEGKNIINIQRQIYIQRRSCHFQQGERKVRDIQRPRQLHIYIRGEELR